MKIPNHGFINQWLVTDMKQTPFAIDSEEKHQIRYEQQMRKEGIVNIKEKPQIEGTWNYYYSYHNYFVDLSTTAIEPMYMHSCAVTTLFAPEVMEVDICIWNYASVTLWVNQGYICQTEAVYKPMNKRVVTVSLNPGENEIFVLLQNVGVRDTRNVFGLQLLTNHLNIEMGLPNAEKNKKFQLVANWLDEITVKEEMLVLPNGQYRASLNYNGKQETLEQVTYQLGSQIKNFTISVDCDGQILKREFEIYHHWKAQYTSGELFTDMAKVPFQKRGSGANFSVYYVLARFATNQVTEKDYEYLLEDLEWIDKRIDCSDFLLAGMIRLFKNYSLPEHIREKAEAVFLNYRYWMDEEGTDGMCFWSENHALMFNSAQMIIGEMYPNQIFTRSGRSGKEQFEVGATRCRQWLDLVERCGFEEFCSATYTPVTLAALLNVLDFSPEDIAKRAKKLLDQILLQLSKHVFDGVVIGPQGRVYRSVIYPFMQSVQEFIHYIDETTPSARTCPGAESMWLSSLATTSYERPVHLIKTMQEPISEVYCADYAEIHLNKQRDFILTSVASPRENFTIEEAEEAKCFSLEWVKQMNECYHGSTLFEPGIYGYQQHMWYAALSQDCIVFTNHPGVSTDRMSMRPGYWYGNGICPAVKQHENMLACIYHIPQEHPIHFAHLFFSKQSFEQVSQVDDWLFGKLNNGYVGIWCNQEQEEFDDVLSECEYRAYGDNIAYVCICGNQEEYGSFDRFVNRCREKEIVFNETDLILNVENDEFIRYTVHEDKKQYI